MLGKPQSLARPSQAGDQRVVLLGSDCHVRTADPADVPEYAVPGLGKRQRHISSFRSPLRLHRHPWKRIMFNSVSPLVVPKVAPYDFGAGGAPASQTNPVDVPRRRSDGLFWIYGPQLPADAQCWICSRPMKSNAAIATNAKSKTMAAMFSTIRAL